MLIDKGTMYLDKVFFLLASRAKSVLESRVARMGNVEISHTFWKTHSHKHWREHCCYYCNGLSTLIQDVCAVSEPTQCDLKMERQQRNCPCILHCIVKNLQSKLHACHPSNMLKLLSASEVHAQQKLIKKH